MLRKAFVAATLMLMLCGSAEAAIYTFYGDANQPGFYPTPSQAEANFQSYFPEMATAYSFSGGVGYFLSSAGFTGVTVSPLSSGANWYFDFNTPVNSLGLFLYDIDPGSTLSIGFTDTTSGANFFYDIPHEPVTELTPLASIFWGYINTEIAFDRMEIGGIGGDGQQNTIYAGALQIGWRSEEPPAVPEPSTVLLLAAGLGGLIVLRKVRS
jgi:hypothetical protein